MKIERKSPDPFYLEGNRDIGILLIHGFTGSPAEMSLLGQFLNQQGFTVYAPLLAGHGTTPEEMARTNKEDWWKSVLQAYDWMKDEKKYQKIIAIGLSMGGVLALKLAAERNLQAVVPLAAPMFVWDKRIGWAKWAKYFMAYQIKKRKISEIDDYLASYDRTPLICVESLNKLIKEMRKSLNHVTVPIQVLQGKKDETVIPKSAQFIYDHVSSEKKEISWYEQSRHIMTLDQEKEQIFVDILGFLERIDNNS